MRGRAERNLDYNRMGIPATCTTNDQLEREMGQGPLGRASIVKIRRNELPNNPKRKKKKEREAWYAGLFTPIPQGGGEGKSVSKKKKDQKIGAIFFDTC